MPDESTQRVVVLQRRAIGKTALGAEESVAWEYQADAGIALRGLAADRSLNVATAAGVVLYELVRLRGYVR